MLISILGLIISSWFISELSCLSLIINILESSKLYIMTYMTKRNMNNVSLHVYYKKLINKLFLLYFIFFMICIVGIFTQNIPYLPHFLILSILGTLFIRIYNRQLFNDAYSLLKELTLKSRNSIK